jgi:Uma2 family endonuclease
MIKPMAMRSPSDPDAGIPAEAPTAPTEEAWARMSPAERDAAVDALLASASLEEIEERDAMAEGDPHLDAKMEIRSTLRRHYDRLGRRIYVGADLKVYYPGRKGFTPDVIAVVDVDPGPRDCWMVSREGKGIDLAFEVHYKGDRLKDFETNLTRYASLRIPEYFVVDLRRRILKAYELPPGARRYQPIPSHLGRFHSRVLDLGVSLEEGRVRFYLGEAMLVTEAELVGKLGSMLDGAVARADEQTTRADQAAVRLASAIVTILTLRGLPVGPEARERILGCGEVTVLERWADRAATAASCEELFEGG